MTLQGHLLGAKLFFGRAEVAAAVEDERVAGQEFGVEEIGNGVGDVAGRAGAAKRGELDEVGLPFGRIAGHGDGAGGDGVDADFRGESFGEDSGEHDDAGFGDGVRDIAGPAEKAAGVGEIDYRALGAAKQRSGGLGAEKRGFQICVERGVPDFFRGGNDAAGKEIGGAVDEDVEAAELLAGFIEEAANFGDAGEGGLPGDGATAEAFDLRDGFLCVFGGGVVVDDKVGAFFGEAEGHGTAEALRGTSDEGDAALQREAHHERKYHDPPANTPGWLGVLQTDLRSGGL